MGDVFEWQFTSSRVSISFPVRQDGDKMLDLTPLNDQGNLFLRAEALLDRVLFQCAPKDALTPLHSSLILTVPVPLAGPINLSRLWHPSRLPRGSLLLHLLKKYLQTNNSILLKTIPESGNVNPRINTNTNPQSSLIFLKTNLIVLTQPILSEAKTGPYRIPKQ
jgi:hypothetical protein